MKRQGPSESSHASARSVLTAWTLHSDERKELEVYDCNQTEAVQHALEALARGFSPSRGMRSLTATVERALRLVLMAQSGVCMIIAPDEQLQRLESNAHCSDDGAMTQYLRGLHVSDREFEKRFLEFTEPTETDRWPKDHPEENLRGRPKDGIAALLAPSGFRVKCAVRLEGLPLACKTWSQRGMRHMTALAAADFMLQAVVLVRSCEGEVHVLAKEPNVGVRGFRVVGAIVSDDATTGIMMTARRRMSKSASVISGHLRTVSNALPAVARRRHRKFTNEADEAQTNA